MSKKPSNATIPLRKHSVESMARVLKSLKIRPQAFSPFTHTYSMYSEEPSLRRLKCTVVKTGQRR